MASYTMELREYIEMFSQDEENLSFNERIKIGRPKLFDFDYPIFDNDYKNVFETNFIKNFYMREIGFETEGLFKFRLETWLNINMPYFNKLFESELIKFDPLINENIKVNHTKKNEGSNSSNRNFNKIDNNNMDNTLQKDINENGQKDNSQNDSRNLTHDKDSTGTDKTVSKDKTDSTITNKGTGETTGESNGHSINKHHLKDATFTRDLESNTPDNRLEITTKDGSGIIEYASKIEEHKIVLNRDKSDETTTKDNTKTNSKTDSTAKDITNVDSTLNKDTSNKDKITENEERDVIGNESYNKTLTDNERGSKNERNTSNITDGVTGNINGIEDYTQLRLGKVGTITHSQMLKEFRETFLRLEKEIFTEMNELFMLVY